MDLKDKRFFSKYREALFIILVYYVFLLGLFVYFTLSETYSVSGPYLTPLIPSNNQYVEVMLILLVFSPISALIGGLVGGYLFAPVFLFIHKNILGSKLIYGIQERSQPHVFKKILRGYYPALLTVNINSIILFSAPWIYDLILNKELLESESKAYSTIYVPGFLVLLMFTLGLGMLVFSFTWFLTDAGIVYSNEERVAGTGQPVEGRTVGGRYTDFLRGYAGIGVIFSYIQFLSVYISEQTLPPNLVDIIVFLMFFLGLPVFLLIAVIPSLIFLDITREHRICYVRNIAEKMRITDFVKFSVEKIDK
jgi:hypothetical protein